MIIDWRILGLFVLNCHSQTETYSRSKIKNKCPDCGITISSKSKYCVKCSAKHREINEIPSINDLVEQYKLFKKLCESR